MLEVNAILELHRSTTILWHQQSPNIDGSEPLKTVCQQHLYNFQLWHQEDIARSPSATDAQVAEVKRRIDQLNQARNDYIEKIDDWLTQHLATLSIKLHQEARQNTETVGSVIDRLSIMSLRIYHYQEQLLRTEAGEEHLKRVGGRLSICQEQLSDLSRALTKLLEEILSGRAIHKTYRQFKMYNDPTLNPYLYSAEEKSRSEGG